MDIDINMLLLLFAALLVGILMVMAAERNLGSEPPHLPSGGSLHIGPHHDLGYNQYPFDPYYLEYLRRQRSRNFWVLLFTVIFTIVLVLLFLYG